MAYAKISNGRLDGWCDRKVGDYDTPFDEKTVVMPDDYDGYHLSDFVVENGIAVFSPTQERQREIDEGKEFLTRMREKEAKRQEFLLTARERVESLELEQDELVLLLAEIIGGDEL